MKKLISLVLIYSLLIVLSGCAQKTTQTTTQSTTQTNQQQPVVKVPGVTDTTITTGTICDMTGPVASTVAPWIQGVKDYIQLTNENGGVNGRKIEMNIQDDQYTVDKAVAGFRKIIETGTFALLGQVGSPQYAALEPEINDAKIPVFGPMQTIKLQETNTYTYNTIPGYGSLGDIFIKRVLALYKGTGKPKIAYWCINNPSGDELEASVKAAAQAAGISIVQVEKVPPNTTEVAAQMLKLKQSGADYVVAMLTTPVVITYLRDAFRLGTTNIPILNSFGAVSPVVPETVGKEAAINYSGEHTFAPYDSPGPGMDELRQYASKHQVDAKYLSNMTYVQGWTNGKLFVEAVRRAGKNLTRESFMKAIESINNFDTGGLSGPANFGPNQRNAFSSARFYEYNFDQKKMLPVSDYYSAK